MNDTFETDGALRAEYAEIENKKLNKIRAEGVRVASKQFPTFIKMWSGSEAQEFLEFVANELEQRE